MLPVTVSPQSASDATSGVGGIGSALFNFGANPNTGFLTGGAGISWPVLLIGAAVVYLLVRR